MVDCNVNIKAWFYTTYKLIQLINLQRNFLERTFNFRSACEYLADPPAPPNALMSFLNGHRANLNSWTNFIALIILLKKYDYSFPSFWHKNKFKCIFKYISNQFCNFISDILTSDYFHKTVKLDLLCFLSRTNDKNSNHQDLLRISNCIYFVLLFFSV